MNSKIDQITKIENSNILNNQGYKLITELLIVDDDTKFNSSLIEILKHYGYDTLSVNSGAEAIALLRTQTIKLILLDLNMPEVDGYSVLKFIDENAVQTSVIILSGETSFEAATKSMCYEFVYDFIKKPYQVKNLLALIKKTLDRIKSKEDSLAKQIQSYQSEQMHRLFVENSAFVPYFLNQAGNFTFLNDDVTDLLGYSRAKLHGIHFSELILKDDLEKAKAFFNQKFNTLESFDSVELRLNECYAEESSQSIEITALSVPFSQMKLLCPVLGLNPNEIGVYGTINKLKSGESHINAVTHSNVSTKFTNPDEFDQRLKRLVCSLAEKKVEHILCYLMIDKFTNQGETLKYSAEENLPNEIAERLVQIVRSRDIIVKFASDELAILMEHCSLDQALRSTQRIHRTLENLELAHGNDDFVLNVSIGLVRVTNPQFNAKQYLQQANLASYVAKVAKRRNQTHVYIEDEGLWNPNKEDPYLLGRINQALDKDLFCLFVQPIVSTSKTQPSKHCEILLRMKDSKNEPILPAVFIPTVEYFKLSSHIDRWVISKVFGYFIENPTYLSDLGMISINLFGLSLHDGEFIKFIQNQFKLTGIPGNLICFEISEAFASGNLSLIQHFMLELKNTGCKFALDDFGNGYSSFNYLKELPVDFLKIDGLFVKACQDNKINLTMLKSVNDIGHVLGKKVIAKSVENQVIFELLQDLQVDYMQGNYLEVPLPIFTDISS